MARRKVGDGWKYRGRGAIQLTGKATYEECVKDLEMPFLLADLDRFSKDLAFDSAAWYFWKRGIFELCTDTDLSTIKKDHEEDQRRVQRS
jgi:putative chitinase